MKFNHLRSTLALAAIGAIALGALATASASAQKSAKAPATPVSQIFPLDSCPVGGNKLTDKPVTRIIDGREVRFCCDMCPTTFEANKAKYVAKIDAAIIEQQAATYPLEHCIVVEEHTLLQDGKVIGVNHVYENRLVRVCCDDCIIHFEKNPGMYFAKLDAAIIEKQSKDYPLTNCPVGGGPLGSMGEPVNLIVGGRLIKLCCAGCEPKVRAQPAKYIAMIDDARAKAAPAQ